MQTAALIAVVLVTAQTAEGSWTLTASPYSSTYLGHPCTILALTSSEGALAQVIRFDSAQAPPSAQLGGVRWRTLADLPDGATGQWADCGWGIQAVIRNTTHVFWLTLRPALPNADGAVREVLAAALNALKQREQRGAVADVRARPAAQLAAERWVAPLVELSCARPEPVWTKPQGIVARIVIGADCGKEGPESCCPRLPAGVRRISFAADICGSRPRTVRVVWYVDGRPVRASKTVARPGGRIVGWLTAGHGLPAGRYRVEVQSSDGVEARAEVLLVPNVSVDVSSAATPR